MGYGSFVTIVSRQKTLTVSFRIRAVPGRQAIELGLVFGKNERNLLQYD